VASLLGCGLGAYTVVGVKVLVNNQNGVDVQLAISNLAIGFPLLLELQD